MPEEIPLPSSLYRYRPELEGELKSAVSHNNLPLYTMIHYHLGLGWADEKGHPQEAGRGKLLRPTLCLLACEAVGGDWHRALPAAAAVELIHNFTLIHDDIEDGSQKRRHRPTIWKIWGVAQGINTGDGLCALAQLTIHRLQDRGVPPEKVLQASRLLSQASLRLCEGQYLDLSYQSHPQVEVEDYLGMIQGKTAQLFECSLSVGAILGTEDPALVSDLASFGRNLGISYQIQDDLLGIWGEEKVTGKLDYADIRERRTTLPLIYALKKTEGEGKEKLTNIYQKTRISVKDVKEVLHILNRVGARDYAEQVKQQYQLKALLELERMRLPSWADKELRELATFALK